MVATSNRIRLPAEERLHLKINYPEDIEPFGYFVRPSGGWAARRDRPMGRFTQLSNYWGRTNLSVPCLRYPHSMNTGNLSDGAISEWRTNLWNGSLVSISRWLAVGLALEFLIALAAAPGGIEEFDSKIFSAVNGSDESALLTLIAAPQFPLASRPYAVQQLLSRSVAKGWTNTLSRLLALDLIPKKDAVDGATVVDPGGALVAAVRAGQLEATRMLLAAGVDPNAYLHYHPDQSVLFNVLMPLGYTGGTGRRYGLGPLTEADPSAQLPCIELLLAAGAQLYPKTKFPEQRFPEWPENLEANRFIFLDYILTNRHGATRRDGRGDSSLHLAARYRRPELMPELFRLGLEVNATNQAGHTPLRLLAEQGGKDPLLQAIYSRPPPPGFPPFPSGSVFATRNSDRWTTASVLLAHGARHDGFSAAGLGDTNALTSLLKDTPGLIHLRDEMRRTPLHWAIANASPAAVSVLVGAGSDLGAEDAMGNTPLHSALGWWPNSVLPLLIKAGAPLEKTNSQGLTPLAAGCVVTPVAQTLIKAGAQVEPAPPRVRPLIHALRMRASSDALLTLLEAGARLDLPAPDGSPLGFWIVQNRSGLESLPVLVGKGLDLNARDARGSSLLDIAAEHLNETVTLTLEPSILQRLADKNPTARKALGWLQTQGVTAPYVPFTNVTVLQLLTQFGLNVLGTNQWGENLLHRVLSPSSPCFEPQGENWGEAGNIESIARIRALLAAGVPLEARDRRGQTPFLTAVRNCRFISALELLHRGADPLATNRLGETAFHLMGQIFPDWHVPEKIPHLKILCRILISRGLKPHQPNLLGFTAIEEAERRRTEELLGGREAGSKFNAMIAEVLKKMDALIDPKDI